MGLNLLSILLFFFFMKPNNLQIRYIKSKQNKKQNKTKKKKKKSKQNKKQNKTKKKKINIFMFDKIESSFILVVSSWVSKYKAPDSISPFDQIKVFLARSFYGL